MIGVRWNRHDDDNNDNDDDENATPSCYSTNCRAKARRGWCTATRAKVVLSVVRLCQLDAGRWSVVASGAPTTWRLRSNEAEASLHADARRLRETAAKEVTRAGREDPPRPEVETARHGTGGTCRILCFFYLAHFRLQSIVASSPFRRVYVRVRARA